MLAFQYETFNNRLFNTKFDDYLSGRVNGCGFAIFSGLCLKRC